jgi:hypothetical protein
MVVDLDGLDTRGVSGHNAQVPLGKPEVNRKGGHRTTVRCAVNRALPHIDHEHAVGPGLNERALSTSRLDVDAEAAHTDTVSRSRSNNMRHERVPVTLPAINEMKPKLGSGALEHLCAESAHRE